MGVSVAVSMAMTVIMVMMVMAMSVIVIMIVLPSQMVVSISRVKDFDLNKVEDETHNSNNQHEVALDSWRLEETLSCLAK